MFNCDGPKHFTLSILFYLHSRKVFILPSFSVFILNFEECSFPSLNIRSSFCYAICTMILSQQRQLSPSSVFFFNSAVLLQLINCKSSTKKVSHTWSAKWPKWCHPSTWTSQFAHYFLINQIMVPQGRRAAHEGATWQQLSAEWEKCSLKDTVIILTRWEMKRGRDGSGELESVCLTSLLFPRLETQHMLFIGKPIILNLGTGENLNDICKPWFISLLNSGICLRHRSICSHRLVVNVYIFAVAYS